MYTTDGSLLPGPSPDRKSSPSSFFAATSSATRRQALSLAACVLLLLLGLNWASSTTRESWTWTRSHDGSSDASERSWMMEVAQARGVVPGVKELLTDKAPAASMYEALRPDLRYLVSDSWSGLTGQFLTAMPLLHLAQLTNRVAIIPSWHDEGHYGSSIIRMSEIFDLERFRNETGILFVEWDDVKPNIEQNSATKTDELGCYVGHPWFQNALTFHQHDVRQEIFDDFRPSNYTFEQFARHESAFAERHAAVQSLADDTGRSLSRNLLEETQEAGVLCYANLWDMKGEAPVGDATRAMQRADRDTSRPDWWTVGRYLNFQPEVWEFAMSSVYATLKTNTLPPLITVHIRRGDFLTWCSEGTGCTPSIDAYKSAVLPLLARSPPSTKVLVTTDETSDTAFLKLVDDLGWLRVDHVALRTAWALEARWGSKWQWFEGAVDQAILSLGSAGFVGTSNSQVSQVAQMRVGSGGRGKETFMVERQRPSS